MKCSLKPKLTQIIISNRTLYHANGYLWAWSISNFYNNVLKKKKGNICQQYIHIYIYIYIYICVCVLYIDLRPGQTCHSKVMHRKEVTLSEGGYGKKSRMRAWLMIWDKVKSHGTVIDWCTGREWPVNCMTVISAWWRSNMPFQRYLGDWTII